MIQERYCSFEVSKLLKEKGFDEECHQIYDNEGYLFFNHVGYINSEKPNEDFYALAPTHQMAMDWLNETHNIFIIIEPYSNTSCYFSLWKGDNYYENPLRKEFPSYGETVEAALKYCLTELMKGDE